MINTLLQKMVERVSDEPEFIAYLIKIFLDHESLSWDMLATELQLSSEQLGQLALCKRPQKGNFREAIKQITDFIQVSPLLLANFVRQAENFEAYSAPNGLSQMAARDRDPEGGE